MTVEYLKKNKLILFEGIVGSRAYGTNIESSDTDIKGVFIQPIDDILGNKYIEQVNDSKNDIVYYEIRRFLQLCASNNPTLLELLYLPVDCILYKHPVFDLVLDNKDIFITKGCKNSFSGYAVGQIGKAKGQNKKQNWERDKVIRKDLLDFCYVIQDEKTIPFKKSHFGLDYKPTGLLDRLFHKKYDVRCFGLANVPHAKDIYALYYNDTPGFYKGLVKVGDDGSDKPNYVISNQLRLSSIPKGELSLCNIVYNKDGYSEHCKDFREYEEWLQKRNLQRWVDVKSHGQQIDGKNMMHCRRLVDMAREIAEGKGIVVKRPNVTELLSIRRGEVDLQTLIDHVDSEIKEIDRLFKESNLPDKVDQELVNNLLVKIRKTIYGL